MKTTQRALKHYQKLGAMMFCIMVLGSCIAGSDILQHWTTNQVSSIAGMNCVIYANGRYVAYGEYSDYGLILSSEDAKTWTVRSDGGPGPSSSGLSYAVGLCFAGNRFFALGGFGTSAVSSNGLDWTIFSLPNYATPAGVAFSGTRYAAVSDGGSPGPSDLNISSSSDGITWTAQHSTSANGAALSDIAWGAGKFVALGGEYGAINDLGHTYTATALGQTWTQRSIPPGGRYISFLKDIFIVPFSAGTNLLSADGLNWATVSTGITNRLGKALFYNGIFMARADSCLATSVDGTNWTRYTATLPGTAFRDPDIATDGNTVVTVGRYYHAGPNYYDGFVYSSDDLVSLRMSNSPPPTLVISGLVGRSNRIDYANVLPVAGTNSWQPLTNMRLESQSAVITDPSAQNAPQRFYRAVLLP